MKIKNKEYFLVSFSRPAPFFPDQSFNYRKASSPKDAVKKLKANYKSKVHPAGLLSGAVYKTAEDYMKNRKPLYVFENV